MKKYLLIVFAVLLVLGCERSDEGILDGAKTYTVYAGINQDSESRIYIEKDGDQFAHLWQSGDHISIINSDALTTANDFELVTGDGQASATFAGAVPLTTSFYAIYPHKAANRIVDGKYSVTFPEIQTYYADTYDPASNVYVAQGENNTIRFTPATAYLQLSLYSTSDDPVTVSKITISTIGGEKISGAGLVTLSAGTASVEMDGEGSSTITLQPVSPVTIASGTDSTRFYIAVPAISYDASFEGYQIKVYSGSGSEETYQWRNIGSALTPNTVRTMPRLLYIPQSKESYATLTTGGAFCRAIKKLANPENAAAIDETLNTECLTIEKVIFETKKNLTGMASAVDVSSAGDKSILATFKDGVIRVQTAAAAIRANTNCASMFRYITNLSEILNLDLVDFSSTTNFAYFFYHTDVRDVDLSSADLSNVINTRMTFYECSSLESVDFGLNTFAKDTSMADLFYNCVSLREVDLSKFDTRAVINSRYMFYRCSTLTSITFGGNCTFEKDTSFSNMFRDCASLTSLDLSSFNSAAVSSTRYMFGGDSKLSTITFGTKCTFPVCVQYGYMFADCSELTSLDLSMFGTTTATTTYRSLVGMFSNCKKLSSVSFRIDNKFAIRYVTNTNSMFKGCSSLTTLDIRGIRRGASTGGASLMFAGCTNLVSLTLGSNYSYVTLASSMFEDCEKLTTLKTLDNSGTEVTTTMSRATDMSRMFYGCTSLTGIPSCLVLSSASVTSVKEMFANCSFTSLNCSALNSTALTNADGFVDNCSNLTSLSFGDNFTGTSLTSTSFMAANPSVPLTINCKTALKDKLLSLQPALSSYSNLNWSTTE